MVSPPPLQIEYTSITQTDVDSHAGMCFWKCFAAGWLGHPRYFPLLRAMVADRFDQMDDERWMDISATILKEDVPQNRQEELFPGDSDIVDRTAFIDAIRDFRSTRQSGRAVEANNIMIQEASNVTKIGIITLSGEPGRVILRLIKPDDQMSCNKWIIMQQEAETHYKLLLLCDDCDKLTNGMFIG